MGRMELARLIITFKPNNGYEITNIESLVEPVDWFDNNQMSFDI